MIFEWMKRFQESSNMQKKHGKTEEDLFEWKERLRE